MLKWLYQKALERIHITWILSLRSSQLSREHETHKISICKYIYIHNYITKINIHIYKFITTIKALKRKMSSQARKLSQRESTFNLQKFGG